MATTSAHSRSRVETDTFCAACDYNLHGQDVWPDERLPRPLARAICRMVVPPKPPMLLMFLWHADGLTTPTSHPTRAFSCKT